MDVEPYFWEEVGQAHPFSHGIPVKDASLQEIPWMHRAMNIELINRPRLRLRVSQYEYNACYYRTGRGLESSNCIPFYLPGRSVGRFGGIFCGTVKRNQRGKFDDNQQRPRFSRRLCMPAFPS